MTKGSSVFSNPVQVSKVSKGAAFLDEKVWWNKRQLAKTSQEQAKLVCSRREKLDSENSGWTHWLQSEIKTSPISRNENYGPVSGPASLVTPSFSRSGRLRKAPARFNEFIVY